MVDQHDRLRGLFEAGIALTSELSLDLVLRSLAETAASLTGARYAALGVVAPSGKGLERFIHTGIDEQVVDEIGEFPVGRGILGVLIRDARPLRLHDLTEDPRSVGFPPGHPEMRTFLGVPVFLRGVTYGNLYLTEKDGGDDFTEEDEEIVTLLAAQAAVAIENARLYESQARWLRQLETMTEVGNALAGELELPRLLKLIATRLRELVGARLVFVSLPTPDGDLRIEAAVADQPADGLVGTRLSREGTKTGRVLERRRAERVDALLDDPEVDHALGRRFASLSGLPVSSTGMFVPLLVRGRAIGAIAIHDKIAPATADLRFTDDDVRLAEAFAARVAVAVDLSQRVERDALRRVVAAQELERKRLARELHDETGQALTSILLGLRTVEETESDDDRKTAISALREMAVATLRDVRRLAVELRPKALDDFGLVPAIERLAEAFQEQTGIQVDFESRLGDRLPSELETSLYRIVQEGLTNVVKHARARHVSVLLTRKDSSVAVVIEDDGRGFSPESAGAEGLGLIGMRERLALVDGTLAVESAPGSGTTLVAEVPNP
jgi:signal transduction histidine kinase